MGSPEEVCYNEENMWMFPMPSKKSEPTWQTIHDLAQSPAGKFEQLFLSHNKDQRNQLFLKLLSQVSLERWEWMSEQEGVELFERHDGDDQPTLFARAFHVARFDVLDWLCSHPEAAQHPNLVEEKLLLFVGGQAIRWLHIPSHLTDPLQTKQDLFHLAVKHVGAEKTLGAIVQSTTVDGDPELFVDFFVRSWNVLPQALQEASIPLLLDHPNGGRVPFIQALKDNQELKSEVSLGSRSPRKVM